MQPKKERYRRIRGALLKFLAYEHPGSVDLKVLHYLLDDLRYTITEEELRSHLGYLGEKGYLRQEKRKSGHVEIEIITITAQGLDALDGFSPESGINTDF